ncbi:hypothetical protein E2C01_074850 [Portunus trituberculatus]|uniref:Uncharacterized protein n=1 Tax=Portunus trituberculatus TaxID=210409 RepID=A0A5B7IE86_PORTR|nr:hypothetical protein [Portunus trituberculatus]
MNDKHIFPQPAAKESTYNTDKIAQFTITRSPDSHHSPCITTLYTTSTIYENSKMEAPPPAPQKRHLYVDKH